MTKYLKIFGYDTITVNSTLKDIFELFRTVDYKAETVFDDTLLMVSGEQERDVDNALRVVYENFGNAVYADENITLSQRALDFLKLYKYKLSAAESLTGGLICSAIIDNEGASEVFYEGLVAYSNESKKDRLGVKEGSLNRYGAVSKEVCIEMLEGLLSDSNADIALASTGIAGPGGATEHKPIGLTYIGVADYERHEVFEHVFQGNRDDIRHKAANTALFHLINRLKQPMDFSAMVIGDIIKERE